MAYTLQLTKRATGWEAYSPELCRDTCGFSTPKAALKYFAKKTGVPAMAVYFVLEA